MARSLSFGAMAARAALEGPRSSQRALCGTRGGGQALAAGEKRLPVAPGRQVPPM